MLEGHGKEYRDRRAGGVAVRDARVIVRDMNWISVPGLTGEMRVKAKLRYRQKEQPAVASPLDGGRILLTFDEPQRGPAIGQAAVLYDGDTVVGGGTICGVPKDGRSADELLRR